MRARQTAGTRRGTTALAILAALLALAASAGAQSAAAAAPVRVSTGKVSHVLGTSGQLNGVLIASGVPSVSVFFEYGPTTAYGSKTKAVAITPPPPSATGTTQSIKIGQPATGLLTGYHYRIVATYVLGEKAERAVGGDKSFTGGKLSKLRFVLRKGKEERLSAIYGGTLELAGSLTGTGNANHGLTLQATPFPYTEPFTTLGGTVLSSRTGSFVFKVGRLTGDTQMRILTVDPRPLYSPVVTVHVTPRITLHVRSAGRTGLYRFYGTVAPSRPGAQLTIQQLTPQKASSKREGPAAHSVGSSVLKRATKSLSRFSVIVSLSGTSHYRAYVKLAKGAIESGHSANVLIKAPPAKGGTKKK